MAHYLAVDLGGTKTLLQICNAQGEVQIKQNLASSEFASFDELLAHFLILAGPAGESLDIACIAVAGPVTGIQARVTKLPWLLEAEKLSARFNIGQVILCNDFEAVGYGIECLAEQDLEVLQAGEPVMSAPRAVIGAGTGLGQAILMPQQNRWHVLPTEGGHVDFAPADQRQSLLLEHLTERFGHVSYDRIVCGSGLNILYHFIRDYEQWEENPQLRIAMMEHDPAGAISEYALQYGDPLASEALDLFVSIYGAQAGNLALNCLPRAGLYLAGGIAAKNMERFQNEVFMDAFLKKGRMRYLMEQIPVYIVLQPEVGLMGADLLARKALYNN